MMTLLEALHTEDVQQAIRGIISSDMADLMIRQGIVEQKLNLIGDALGIGDQIRRLDNGN